MIRVPENVLQVLAAAQFSGNSMMITGEHLDRQTYSAVAKVIEAAGGKWNKKAKVHLFDGDAGDAIEPILLTGEYSRTKQDFGQFDSPPEVARQVIRLADIWRGLRVLEPNAGIGNLAVPAIEAGAIVHAVELDPKRCATLTDRIAGLTQPAAAQAMVQQADFLCCPSAPTYDRVVMNPPFPRQADIDHVRHALRFLAPRGLVVSVMSAGVIFRQDRRATDFRELVYSRGGSIERLPEGAFKSSGTMVNACIAVIPGEDR